MDSGALSGLLWFLVIGPLFYDAVRGDVAVDMPTVITASMGPFSWGTRNRKN